MNCCQGFRQSCPEPVTDVTINNYNYYRYPVGHIFMWPAEMAHYPDGALKADGAWVNKSVYNALYSVIGGTYGETSTTFRLPTHAPTDSGFISLIQALDYGTVIDAERRVLGIASTVEDVGGVLSVDIEIQVLDNNGNPQQGVFALNVWFTDAADEGTPSVVPPTTPGVSQMHVSTNQSGLYELRVEHVDPIRSWYLKADLASEVFTAGPITAGTP